LRDIKPKHKKLVKSGHGLGHVTYFSNFGTPLISLERLKIETSNLACRLTLRDTKPKNKNLSKGAWPKSRDTLFKFWDLPNIFGTADDTNLKFHTLIDLVGY